MDTENDTKILTTTSTGALQTNDSEYVKLVSLISDVWEKAKGNAAFAVNTGLLHANWETSKYILENPNSVWTIDMEPLSRTVQVR